MSESSRWSPTVRAEIQMAMNAVIREAHDIVTRRSEGGQWLPPGETGEVGDNPGLGRAAEIWVLAKLEAQIQEAREVISRVQHECAVESGISSKPSGRVE